MTKNSSEVTPLIQNFCDWLEEQKKSPSTVLTYRREMQKFQEWLQEKGTSIEKLKKIDIQSYMDYLEGQKRSVTTIDKIAGVIRTFAKYLGKPELTFGLEIKPVEKTNHVESLSATQYMELLQRVKEDGNQRDIAIVHLMLHTGIRISELCNLDRVHINFQGNEVIVNRNDDTRVIPLSKEAREYLKAYLDSHPYEAVFVSSRTGERLSERTIQYMLKSYDVSPQILRHTFCQRLIDNNVDVEIVAKLAGHKDINVTKKYIKTRMNKRNVEAAINNAFKSIG